MVTLDWVMIALYVALLAGLTWWSVSRNRNTPDDRFLAGRDLGWVVVGASIFATNVGSEHLAGLAGAGATSGVALAHDELLSLLTFLVSIAVLIVVSYTTRPPSDRQPTGLTSETVTPAQRRASMQSWTRFDVTSSAIVLLLITAADAYFNG